MSETSRAQLLADINADVPRGVDWRQGAIDYVSAELRKHGPAYVRYLLNKPFAPVPADPDSYRPALRENVHYLANFLNVLQILDLCGGSCVVDVACGSGWFAQFFARMAYDVHGFDICSEMVNLTRQRFQEDPALAPFVGGLNERFFVLDIERAPLPGRLHGAVDAIILESCMHHFHDPISAMQNLVPGLKDDGIVIIIEGENRRGPLRPEYLDVMREFSTLERPYTRSQFEAVLDFVGLPHRAFMGRVNGWFTADDPRIRHLPEMLSDDAAALNLAVCARKADALRRVVPHYGA